MRKLAVVAISAALPLMAITPVLAKQNNAPPSQSQTQAQPQSSQQMNGQQMNDQQSSADQNMSPNKIRKVQQALDNKGFKAGHEDGQLGPETKSALNQFQKKQHLKQTGKPDQETLAALGVDQNNGTQNQK